MSPKVHVMSEPEFGILVTGTHDIELARMLAEPEAMEHLYLVDSGIRTSRAVTDWFRQHPGKQRTGRIIPERPAAYLDSGVAWWWRTGYELGKPGVTRAVVFQ